MFAIVNLISAESRFSRSKKSQITSEKIAVDGERFFFIINVKVYKNKVPYEKIRAYAGNLKNSLIFPGCGYMGGESLDLFRLFNNSLEYLRRLDEPPRKTSVCIYDRRGELSERAHLLLPLASRLHVVCAEKEKYDGAAQRMMREYGFSLSVSEGWGKSADGCNNVITPDSDILPLGYRGRVFTLKKRILPDAKLVIGEGIILPEKYERLRPEAIDRDVFAKALYDKWGINGLENCKYEKIFSY